MLFRAVFVFAAATVSSVEAGFWSSEENVEDEAPRQLEQVDDPVEYGVDVSFPIQYATVSDNYAWLPHNLDPSIPTPDRYKDMVVQTLGDRRGFYQEYIDGCREKFGKKGSRCTQSEIDRMAMSLRQPQSMQVRSTMVQWMQQSPNIDPIPFFSHLFCFRRRIIRNWDSKVSSRKSQKFRSSSTLSDGFSSEEIKAPDHIYRMVKDFWDANKDKAKTENWGMGNTYT
jgi:hypothetical protein